MSMDVKFGPLVQTSERLQQEMREILGRQKAKQLQPLGCLAKYKVHELLRPDEMDTAEKNSHSLRNEIDQKLATVAEDISAPSKKEVNGCPTPFRIQSTEDDLYSVVWQPKVTVPLSAYLYIYEQMGRPDYQQLSREREKALVNQKFKDLTGTFHIPQVIDEREKSFGMLHFKTRLLGKKRDILTKLKQEGHDHVVAVLDARGYYLDLKKITEEEVAGCM